MTRLTLVALAMVVGMVIGAVVAAPGGGRAQDTDAARLAALETRVADLAVQADQTYEFALNNATSIGPLLLPPPVPASDLGWFTVGQSFTADNAFRLVCRVGELNTYVDLTCIRATFP